MFKTIESNAWGFCEVKQFSGDFAENIAVDLLVWDAIVSEKYDGRPIVRSGLLGDEVAVVCYREREWRAALFSGNPDAALLAAQTFRAELEGASLFNGSVV